jgi:hypothetical protein
MHNRKPFAVASLAALAAVSACSSSSTGPATAALDTQISTNVANNAAQAVATDYSDLMSGMGVGGSYAVVRPSGTIATRAVSNGCTQSGGGGDLRYYCPADTVVFSGSSQTDTVIRQRNYEFFAAGTPQPAFTSITDSINFGGATGVPTYFALHTSQSIAVSHRVRSDAVTDKTPSFASDSIRTWNGTTTAADTGSYGGSPYNVSFTGWATDALVNVVVVHPPSKHPYPISGQFRRTAHWGYTYTGAGSGSGSVTRTVVVTFDGTKTPTLQVTGGKTLTCVVDLTNSNVSNCH